MNLRRAERDRLRRFEPPPENVEPQSTGPIHRKVRSLFLGVLSVFVPRSILGRPAPAMASTPAAALPAPRTRETGRRPLRPLRKRTRGRWLPWLLVPVVAGLAVVVAYQLTGKHSGIESAIELREPEPQALQIGDLNVLTATLSLYYPQPAQIRQILQEAERDYLEIEQRHTERKVDGTRLQVTISPFAEEVSQLEDRVRAKLDSILTSRDQREKAEKQLPPRGQLFPFGKGETSMTFWREGAWYHWQINRGSAAGGEQRREQGSGTQLPGRYQRFWQGGPAVK
jgi:hypothetical protein